METPCRIPDSNADIVAFNLVCGAIVDNVTNPGTAIARLLEIMAAMSRNVGGDVHAANTDWHGSLSELADGRNPDFAPIVNRQELTIGEIWAQQWMLAHIAKHLYLELERTCMESPAAPAIQSVMYSNAGTVETWKKRS